MQKSTFLSQLKIFTENHYVKILLSEISLKTSLETSFCLTVLAASRNKKTAFLGQLEVQRENRYDKFSKVKLPYFAYLRLLKAEKAAFLNQLGVLSVC